MHLKDIIRMTFTFKIPYAMYVGFKIFKKKFKSLKLHPNDQFDQAQIWCIKNIHSLKNLKPNDEPG
jgi:hypothetical protein